MEYITITFAPSWKCFVHAKLQVTNLSTMEIHEYTLNGLGEEPFQEETIEMTVKAKELSKFKVWVKNDFEWPMEYLTECNVPDT
jgi:hypothetical protein